jgi:transglutaminase-like putative cysteine protease
MRYRIRHETRYAYSAAVAHGLNVAHLLPRDTPNQRCLHTALAINPGPASLRGRADYFGNRVTHFAVSQPHRSLRVVASSEVALDPPGPEDPDAAVLTCAQAAERLAGATDPDGLAAREMALASPMVPLSSEARDYAAASFAPDRPLLEAVTELIGRIYADFTYDPTFTSIATPIAEVLAHRRGVCQDFAHLGLACLRAMGVAARYVSGYLETRPPPGKPKLEGADASHAWLAAYLPGHGWLDFDPTNDLRPQERHVTLAWGRDYGDVTPLRGVVTGGGQHRLSVAVDVMPLEEEEAPASP